MNQSLVKIQAKLDETKSLKNINKDIARIQKKIDALKLKADIDPKTISKLVKQLEKICNQKINLSDINIDKNAVAKAGKEISATIEKENANNKTPQIFNASDLDKQGRIYIQKVSNTLEKAKSEIEGKLHNAGYADIKITGLEEANGKIKALSVNATDASGSLKQLNFERANFQINGETQSGLIQTNDVKVLGNISSSIEKVQGNLSSLKTDWEKQGILVGEFKTKVEELETSLASVRSKEGLSSLQSKISDLNQSSEIFQNLDDQKYDRSLSDLIASYEELGLSSEEIQEKTKEVSAALEELRERNLDTLIQNEENFSNALQKSEKEAAMLKNNLDSINTTKQTKLSDDIQLWLNKNSYASKEAKEELNKYFKELNSGRIPVSRLEYIQEQFNSIKSSQTWAGKIGKIAENLSGQFKSIGNSVAQLFSITRAFDLISSSTREAISELKEVDTLLTEISRADGTLSKSELKSIGNNSFEIASKYGKKASDYLSEVQEASRAGYDNAADIAELSIAVQETGGITAELANQYITATDKAYGLGGSVEKLTEILDGSNYITDHNAVNMAELAEGMSIVGSQAASLGISADKTTAALGTMIAATQQSGTEMAKAFKAILRNLQQVTDEEEGIDAEGLAKYEKACEALNVSLKETKNGVTTLRDPMAIIKDLAEEYSKLDDNDIRKTNLLSSVGGKTNSNALDAILENYDMYANMLEQYKNGTGSMASEAEKVTNSWEGSLNRLHNTWVDTIGNIADSDAIIKIINTLNDFLSKGNELTNFLGSIGTIGLGAGLFAGIKNVGMAELN